MEFDMHCNASNICENKAGTICQLLLQQPFVPSSECEIHKAGFGTYVLQLPNNDLGQEQRTQGTVVPGKTTSNGSL